MDEALDTIVPDNPNKPYDMREVIRRVVDDGDMASNRLRGRQPGLPGLGGAAQRAAAGLIVYGSPGRGGFRDETTKYTTASETAARAKPQTPVHPASRQL